MPVPILNKERVNEMARTRGSRNKASVSVDERIVHVTQELERLQEQVKQKKDELKQLHAEKNEEDRQRILEAVAASGKSVEEILNLIGGADEAAAAVG